MIRQRGALGCESRGPETSPKHPIDRRDVFCARRAGTVFMRADDSGSLELFIMKTGKERDSTITWLAFIVVTQPHVSLRLELKTSTYNLSISHQTNIPSNQQHAAECLNFEDSWSFTIAPSGFDSFRWLLGRISQPIRKPGALRLSTHFRNNRPTYKWTPLG